MATCLGGAIRDGEARLGDGDARGQCTPRCSHLLDPAGGPPIPDPEASWGTAATAAACSGEGRRSSVALPSPCGSSDVVGREAAEVAWRRRPERRAGAVSSWKRNSPSLPLPSKTLVVAVAGRESGDG
uniref:Uncharacterized protein n=1 Tax=Oryza sativa subsp. japonica TaxID=39947 RepID=Q7EYJ2_ORYSJ|nr:hypothetical protein [Oryza sativa Japonica Group]